MADDGIVIRGHLDFDKVRRISREAIKDSIHDGLELMKAYSVQKTPMVTGHLRDSMKFAVEGPLHGRVYNTADYAIYVHEDLDAEHPIGGAKFIEKTLKDPMDRQDIIDAMASAIRRHF